MIVRRYSGIWVEVASPRFDRYRKVEPGDLEPLPEGEARVCELALRPGSRPGAATA